MPARLAHGRRAPPRCARCSRSTAIPRRCGARTTERPDPDERGRAHRARRRRAGGRGDGAHRARAARRAANGAPAPIIVALLAARVAAQDAHAAARRSRITCARRSPTISTATRRSSPTSSTSTRSSSTATARATRCASTSPPRAARWSTRDSAARRKLRRAASSPSRVDAPATAAASRLNLLPADRRRRLRGFARWQILAAGRAARRRRGSRRCCCRCGRSATTRSR